MELEGEGIVWAMSRDEGRLEMVRESTMGGSGGRKKRSWGGQGSHGAVLCRKEEKKEEKEETYVTSIQEGARASVW